MKEENLKRAKQEAREETNRLQNTKREGKETWT